jgi:3-oxoacyl-[acyl-carrier-protein] synthase II
MERVVITGIGLVTPERHRHEPTWQNVVAGESGIRPITLFDPTGFRPRSRRGEGLRPEEYIPQEAEGDGALRHLAVAAAWQACMQGRGFIELRPSDEVARRPARSSASAWAGSSTSTSTRSR